MTNSVIKTNDGRKSALYRIFTTNANLSSTQYLAPTQFGVGSGQADLDITQTDLTKRCPITGTAAGKAFSTGYPTFDYTNMEVTIRCYVNTLESNGNLLNGVGLFNADSAVLMTDAAKFTGQSKSNTDEFVYVFKNRIM